MLESHGINNHQSIMLRDTHTISLIEFTHEHHARADRPPLHTARDELPFPISTGRNGGEIRPAEPIERQKRWNPSMNGIREILEELESHPFEHGPRERGRAMSDSSLHQSRITRAGTI